MPILQKIIATTPPVYLSQWYWRDTEWVAKTVSVAADRCILQSPDSLALDVGGTSLTQYSKQMLDINSDTAWDFGQGTYHGTWQQGHPYVVGDYIRPTNSHCGDGSSNVSNDYATPIMTSNTAPSGVVSANNENETAYAYKAFNQSTADLWLSKSSAPWCIVYDYGTGNGKCINKYRMFLNQSHYPTSWTIEGSNSNDSVYSDASGVNGWTVLDSKSGILNSYGSVWTSYYVFSNSIPYQKYRMLITTQGGSDGSCSIGELHFVEDPRTVVYRCTSAGTSGENEPTWLGNVGGTIIDGGATWTCFLDKTSAVNRAGKDIYCHAVAPTEGHVPKLLLSANSTYPTGYTANNSRKVAGFHCYCLSMSAPTTWATGTVYAVGKTVIPTVPNGYWYRCVVTGTSGSEPTWPTTVDATVGTAPMWQCEPIHLLAGYVTGDILPASVWDLHYKSGSNIGNNGQVFDSGKQEWIGIYPVSNTYLAPTIVHGGTILVSVDWNQSVDAGRKLNMRLPGDTSFQSLAEGSNQMTNIAGSAMPSPATTIGYTDTAGRRMCSNIGVESCCGLVWQFLDEQGFRFDSAATHNHQIVASGSAESVVSGVASADVAPAWGWSTAMTNYRGQVYKQGSYGDTKVISGGAYSTATNSGSRCREPYPLGRQWTSSVTGIRLIANHISK